MTEDCGLESPPLTNISIIDGELFIAFGDYAHVSIADTRPTSVRVSILCTEEVEPRTIHVEWNVSSCRFLACDRHRCMADMQHY